ncbi:HK97-gp10 family putative phage morphogenesis protein [Planococcus dechangensis]|uniref:HK97-gp10 family putative phage morphogenesis protein n=1 Tax=Planococcus dechangensis TaxID=1176255 RepID=A0ABV9MCD2_9BACL
MANKNYQSYRLAVNAAMKASERAALTAIGEFIEGAAKLNSAVDTGNYRDSWGYRVDDTSVTIGNGAEYAYWLEKGTSRMPAQPALQPAVDSNHAAILALIKGAWKI